VERAGDSWPGTHAGVHPDEAGLASGPITLSPIDTGRKAQVTPIHPYPEIDYLDAPDGFAISNLRITQGVRYGRVGWFGRLVASVVRLFRRRNTLEDLE
jgi:hypothetical protein